MITTNTGIEMMDSGGDNNRHWQRNQEKYKTIEDIEKEPEVSYDKITTEKTSEDILFSVNIFHYLQNVLELDILCNEYNEIKCGDWDGEIYGVSIEQKKWLDAHNLVAGDGWNTYNGDCHLSQTLQGTNLTRPENSSNFEYPDYVLIQIHQGADVRGGYTDAKLFKMVDGEYLNSTPDVHATINGIDADTMYDGNNLLQESGEPVKLKKSGNKITLSL